jgi:hypothetical protein
MSEAKQTKTSKKATQAGAGKKAAKKEVKAEVKAEAPAPTPVPEPAPAPAPAKTDAAAEEAEVQEGGKRKRFFKCLYNGQLHGRYSGDKPKQAANKAFTNIIRSMEGEVTGKVIKFQMQECTRGRPHKVNTYQGERVKLDKPLQIKISKNTDKPKVIEYKFTNKISKVREFVDVQLGGDAAAKTVKKSSKKAAPKAKAEKPAAEKPAKKAAAGGGKKTAAKKAPAAKASKAASKPAEKAVEAPTA